MIGLLIVGFAGAMVVLYVADLLWKARARARRVRMMSARLAAAAARAERQQEQRRAAVQASAALTSVVPAITRPPGDPAHDPVRPRGTRRDRTGPQAALAGRDRTGPQAALAGRDRTGPQAALASRERTGPSRRPAPAGENASRPRSRRRP